MPALDGLAPEWSRTVAFVDFDGVARRAHVLDSWHGREGSPELTLLCVHGNPTWSYLWRRVLSLAPAQWRVIAVDQVGMGFSDRLSDTDGPRRLAQRVDDLGRITEALAVEGPVAAVAHDWGGPVSLGWALAHPDQLAAVVLANTAVTQPPGSPAPALIRAMRLPGVLPAMTVSSAGFLRGALALGRGHLDPPVRQGFLAPYPSAARRRSIGDFVSDIPLDESHPSYATLVGIAEGVRRLTVPALLLWGPDDPVFGDLYLADLMQRLPHADVHRYEGTSHLVTEQAPTAIPDLLRWLALALAGMWSALTPTSDTDLPHPSPQSPRLSPPPPPADLLSALRARAADDSAAVVELGDRPRAVSWRTLAQRVDELASGLLAAGVVPGDRVALLIPPGADLTACAYACWRMGAVVVAVDAGLGVRGMGRALRGAAPDHLIAIPKGLALARSLRLRVAGARVVVGSLNPAARALGAQRALVDLIPLGAQTDLPSMGESSVEAAVVFTSGATGPAKGVVYRRAALEAQRDALRTLYSIGPDDALVAAFAPWAVLGPALGVPSAVPDMDVTAPGSLTARALADAAVAVRATTVWASPAALRSVLASAGDLSPLQRRGLAGVRLLMSAGAPVAVSLLEETLEVMPAAEPHTPYGMTEVLPVADISLAELRAVGPGEGVCVGRPVAGVTVAIARLLPDGSADGEPSPDTGVTRVTGEILVRTAHAKDRYDRLWATEEAASPPGGWHRTGDVGHLDDEGRLWVEGRLQHVITTDRGPVTPVGVEQAAESLAAVSQAAAVGVGPRGTQQVVVIVVPTGGVGRSEVLASLDLVDQVRAAAARTPVAAVLVRGSLPVDRRHNSKIDRAALAGWAADVLAGRPSDGQDAS